MLRQIFFLSSSSLTAYQYDGRALTRMDRFVAADAGLAHFDAYLQHLGQAPTYILTDLVEEDFRIDSVAHVLGRDRSALLERHVARLYRGTEYRHAEVLGRDPHSKRKDEVLFSGLLNSEFVDMWLGAMRHYRVPVAGIYSLPLLSGELVKRLCGKLDAALFVTHNLDSGLRQSFFSRGRLRFSRLTPVPTELSDGEYAEFVQAEVAKTKRYLSNLHLLGRDAVLDVCILSGGTRLAALSQQCENEALTRYRVIEIGAAAQRLRQRGVQSTQYCDELFALLLARHHARNHYAGGPRRFHYQMYRTRQMLAALGLAAAVGGVLWSGTEIVDSLLYRQETAESRRLLAIAQQGYSQVEERLPQADVAPDDMRLAVTVAERLQRQRRTPAPVLTRLGRVFETDPGLQLEQIDWFVAEHPGALAARPAPGEPADVQALEYDADGNTIGAMQEGGQHRYQIGVVQGRVAGFDGDYGRAHRRIEALVKQLRSGANPALVTAEALELPLNTAVSGRVLGGIGNSERQQEALFKLRLVIGEPHDQP